MADRTIGFTVNDAGDLDALAVEQGYADADAWAQALMVAGYGAALDQHYQRTRRELLDAQVAADNLAVSQAIAALVPSDDGGGQGDGGPAEQAAVPLDGAQARLERG